MEKKKVTTTLPTDLFQRLKVQAAKEGRTVTEILEQLITAYMDEKENS